MRSLVGGWLVVAAGLVLSGCSGKSAQSGGMPGIGGTSSGSGGAQGDDDDPTPTVGGGGTGAAGAASSCALGELSQLSARSLGSTQELAFVGPAVVERSTDEDLVLAYQISPAAAGAAAVMGHLQVTGLSPMPRLAPRSSVWVERSVGVYAGTFAPPPDSSFRVLDERGGRLLFGVSSTNSGNFTTSTAPLQVIALHAGCVEPNPFCSSSAAERTWQDVEVQADVAVVLPNGESTKVYLDGVEYDAVATASTETAGNGTCFADYIPHDTLYISVVAADVESLTAELPLGDAPACSLFNDRNATVGFTLFGVSVGTDYFGPVVFLSSALSDGTRNYEFSTPELPQRYPDAPPSLQLSDYSNDFTPPPAGTKLYFESHRFLGGALFEEKGGAPLFVQLSVEPSDEGALSALGAWLGVSVSFDEACDYASGTGPNGEPLAVPLRQLVLGTEPPVIVHSGERRNVTLAGRSYEANLGGIDAYYSFMLRALEAP